MPACRWLILSILLLRPANCVAQVGSAQAESKPTDAAQAEDQDPDRNRVAELVAKCESSIVVIRPQGRDGQTMGLGTGFVIDAKGLIATAYHVIGDARPLVVVTRDGRTLQVKLVLASDRHLDLAILQVDADNLAPLPLSTQALRSGVPAMALGHPLGLEHSVVTGVISATREISGRPMIQVAMPIEPGHSGGPLLDQTRGEVHGIMVMKSSGTEQLGFAVPVDQLRRIWDNPNPVSMDRWMTIGRLDPAKWTTLFGSDWRQVSGRILVEQPGDGFGGRTLCLATASTPPMPFEIGVWVKLAKDDGAAGLVFHSDGEHKHYGFYPSDRKLRLTCFEGPSVYSWDILSEISTPHYRPGEWNYLKVRVESDKIVGYVNDQIVVRSNDLRWGTGRVGLAKFRETSAEFRDFRIAAELPPALPTPDDVVAVGELLKATPTTSRRTSEDLKKFLSTSHAQQVLKQESHRLLEESRSLEMLSNTLHTEQVCQSLGEWMRGPLSERGLLKGALLISFLDNPDLDTSVYELEVDKMVAHIRTRSSGEDWSEGDRLKAIDHFLFEESGFHGSRTEYYHPANSYLDRVIDDREGLPITLSVLYMELGRRLGLTMEGVGLPGHFIVRFTPAAGPAELIDVFDRAKRWSREDAAKLVAEFSGQELNEQHLVAANEEQILVRMLNNLLGIAQERDDRTALARYLEALVMLQPENASMRGMRAVVRREQGQAQAALEDLDWILAHAPVGIDLETVERMRTAFASEVPVETR